MRSESPAGGEPTRVVLKVDVDTRVGLRQGVPRLIEMMDRLGVRASYYVSMGPDNSGRALRRALRPGFLAKQLRAGAAASYGPVTMLYGLALPGPLIAKSAPHLFNQLLELGHEVGLHAWDHVFWHDRVRTLPTARVRHHLGQAWREFRSITGMAPASFASPGWQVTDAALESMARMGLTHVSCGRGVSAFRPVVDGRALPLLEIPTTMPTLDEVLARGDVSHEGAAEFLAGCLVPGELNVYTMHAEVEGRQMAPIFMELVGRMQEAGVVFERLVDSAARLAARGNLPAERVVWGRVPHRAYEVACQQSALDAEGMIR